VALGLFLNFGHPATRRWGPHPKLESRPNPPLNGLLDMVKTHPEKRLIGYARVSTYGQTPSRASLSSFAPPDAPRFTARK
jgi:hypothetical protein